MHIQFRTSAVASPPDVTLLLRRLADGGVNVAAVGGSDIEFRGTFAFAVKDEEEQGVRDVLKDPAHPYVFEEINSDFDDRLTLCEVSDDVGSLHNCLLAVTATNIAKGRIIRDMIVGVPRAAETPGTIPVQVFSEEIRTAANATPTERIESA